MNNIFEEDYTKLEEYDRVYFFNKFYDDLPKILKGYSKVKHFNKWLDESIALLDKNDILELTREKFNTFEHIEDDIYCIRYRHKVKNIRILFQITTINDSVSILLKAFDEKKTKADYDKAKRVARKRKFKQK